MTSAMEFTSRRKKGEAVTFQTSVDFAPKCMHPTEHNSNPYSDGSVNVFDPQFIIKHLELRRLTTAYNLKHLFYMHKR